MNQNFIRYNKTDLNGMQICNEAVLRCKHFYILKQSNGLDVNKLQGGIII